MPLDPLPDPLFLRELRRALGLPADASNAATLAAAEDHAKRLAADQEQAATHALMRLGFGVHFNQAVHGGFVEATQRDAFAEMFARDESAALEVMTTRWRESA